MYFFFCALNGTIFILSFFQRGACWLFQHSSGIPTRTWVKYTGRLGFTRWVQKWNIRGLEAHIPDRAIFGNSIFSWKKVLATKNISMVNDDHRRDISNCLSCIHYHTFSLLPIGSDSSQSLAAGVLRSPDALPAASARSTTGAPILAWQVLAPALLFLLSA